MFIAANLYSIIFTSSSSWRVNLSSSLVIFFIVSLTLSCRFSLNSGGKQLKKSFWDCLICLGQSYWGRKDRTLALRFLMVCRSELSILSCVADDVLSFNMSIERNCQQLLITKFNETVDYLLNCIFMAFEQIIQLQHENQRPYNLLSYFYIGYISLLLFLCLCAFFFTSLSFSIVWLGTVEF